MKNEIYKRLLSSIFLIPVALFFIIKGSFFLIFFLIIGFFISAYEWHLMTKKIKFSLSGYIVLIFSFYSVFELRNNLPGEYFYILLVTIICVATDIGGYLFGKTFKGPKLTNISPNKTYSGMFGGFFLSLISTHVYINNINFAQIKIDTSIEFFLIILLISAISQLGDIIISYFKRLSKIKNTGKIIPGHGGLLDRIDGMIFAFPFSYLIFYSELII
jgi:phosphatidate cytidylyltransferase